METITKSNVDRWVVQFTGAGNIRLGRIVREDNAYTWIRVNQGSTSTIRCVKNERLNCRYFDTEREAAGGAIEALGCSHVAMLRD